MSATELKRKLNDPPSSRVQQAMNELDLTGKVGQLAQIDIHYLLSEDKKSLRQDLVDHYIGELGIGSVLNVIVASESQPVWTPMDYRRAVIQLQDAATRHNRPPVIWGMDSVHGANYLVGPIMTPQPLNLAATFNTTVTYHAGLWASRDTRAAGINWLFSPLLGMAWQPHWSRVYETFGEDPLVVGTMARYMIQGIQYFSDDHNNSTILPSRAAACAKHWLGYPMSRDGHDRAPSWIPTRHLYQYFLPPWGQVLGEVKTVMESYTEVDGVPNVANRLTLDVILRRRMKFAGVLITDYAEINSLADWHHVASNHTMATVTTMQEGTVDMSMIGGDVDTYLNALKSFVGRDDLTGITHQRFDTSVQRVLQLKDDLRMWDESITMDNAASDRVASDEDIRQALIMTQQSIVLTKNENQALPLDANAPLNVLVTGPTSDSLSYQSGGWTYIWQGVDPKFEKNWFSYGSTVYGQAQQIPTWKVSHQCGVNILGGDCEDTSSSPSVPQDPSMLDKVKGWVGWGDEDVSSYYAIERAIHAAKDCDVVIVCVGEESYAEKPGDIRSLRLPQGQYELVEGLRENTEAKIILVYFGGRPRLLQDMVVRVVVAIVLT